jgi:GT2 family glycosyltransferase
MKLSIITLNHNRPKLTIACIESLWKQHKEEFENNEFECLVVDTLSQDNSLQLLEPEVKKYKNIHLFPSNRDAGFGAGNNFGAKKAKGDFILLLNNDTVVEDRGIIKMLDYLKTHIKIGALGGKIYNFDGTEQSASGKFYSLFTVTLFLLGFQRLGLVDKNPTTISQVDWVKGALLMMKRNLFEKLGGFDEKIFLYTEDMELCYRVHKLGLSCVFFPDITIKHKEHGTGNRTSAIINIFTNLPYFYKKHKSTFAYEYVKFLLRLKAITLLTAGKILQNKYLQETYTKALKAIE